LSPRLVASIFMVPLLTVLYTCVGMAGSWFVAIQGLGIDPGVFLSNIEKYMVPRDFWMGEIKAVVFGFLISAVSCNQGFFASGGARGVGIATTRAVVQSSVVILIANYLITSFMTDI
jgi:phospholipid/cholesterol/gamma-HCH transport system permease protein